MKKLVIAFAAAAAIGGFALGASPASAALSADPLVKTETAQSGKQAKDGLIQEVRWRGRGGFRRHWGHHRHWGHRWHGHRHWRGYYGVQYWGPRCFWKKYYTYYGPRFRKVCYR